MVRSRLRRGLVFVAYSFALWILLDAIVAYTGLLVPDERVRWFSDFYMPDSELGFRIQSNLHDFKLSWMKGEVCGSYSTDSLGFRNTSRNYHSSRCFFIGDSFTFGAWVKRDSTFYGLLENKLGEPMITFGVGGYGLAQYDYILQHYCVGVPPESRVVLCLFANDLETLPDSSYLSDYYDRARWQPYTRDASFVDRLSPSRSATWHAARLLARVLFGYGDYATSSDGTILYKRRGATFGYLSEGLYIPFEQKLQRMIAFCHSHQLRLIILLFPSKEAVYHEEYAQLFNDESYLRIEQQGYARIESLAQQQNVAFLNLTGLFRRHIRERLFFRHDPHCNERGHALVADTLVNYLTPFTSGGP